jgi:CHAD domain-containing protein
MATDTKTATPTGQELARLAPAAGLQWLLSQRQQQLTAHYTLFITQGGDEALHDFRVSLRRLRSLLRNYRGIIKPDKRLIGQLRTMQRHTNHARDLEVFITQLQQYAPEHTPLVSELEGQRQQAYHQLRQELPATWAELPSDLTSTLQLRQLKHHPSLGSLTVETTSRQLTKLKKQFRSLHQGWDEALLHQLRIQGKRLRYLLEPFLELGKVHKAIDVMKQFQDELGEYRDLQLLVNYLETEQAASIDLGTSLQHQLQNRSRLIRRFRKQGKQKKVIRPLRTAIKQLGKG